MELRLWHSLILCSCLFFLPGGTRVALAGGLTLEPCNPHGLLGTSGEDDDGPSSAPGYHSEPQANRWVGKGETPQYRPWYQNTSAAQGTSPV